MDSNTATALQVTNSGGRLDGVTMSANLTLDESAFVYVENGLVLNSIRTESMSATIQQTLSTGHRGRRRQRVLDPDRCLEAFRLVRSEAPPR